jgi:hypothetical protein
VYPKPDLPHVANSNAPASSTRAAARGHADQAPGPDDRYCARARAPTVPLRQRATVGPTAPLAETALSRTSRGRGSQPRLLLPWQTARRSRRSGRLLSPKERPNPSGRRRLLSRRDGQTRNSVPSASARSLQAPSRLRQCAPCPVSTPHRHGSVLIATALAGGVGGHAGDRFRLLVVLLPHDDVTVSVVALASAPPTTERVDVDTASETFSAIASACCGHREPGGRSGAPARNRTPGLGLRRTYRTWSSMVPGVRRLQRIGWANPWCTSWRPR